MSHIDFGDLLVQYFCLVFSLCVHEAAHAATANWCGDPSPKFMGRLTLDPRRHVDPIGTVALPILMMLLPGAYLFGWAKPVLFNPRNLKNYSRDPVLIALAGPISNVLIALSSAILLRVLLLVMATGVTAQALNIVALILVSMIIINIVLALFNMIPLPPLDGHHVLYYFLPSRGKEVLASIGPFGIIIAILVLAPMLQTPMIICFQFFITLAAYGIEDAPDLLGNIFG